MTIETQETPTLTADRAVELFLSLRDEGININNISIVCAKKTIGETSSRVLNERIQNAIFAGKKCGPTIEHSYSDGTTNYRIKYHIGDRVLVTRNCYRIPMTNNLITSIFNGYVGTVTDINEDEGTLIVNFYGEEVVVRKKMLDTLQLGYALTTHKAQGSTIPYVIAICDINSYILLSKEFLYTQISRAKKACYLLGSAKAIRYATKTSGNRNYKTWLSELLFDYFYKTPLTQQ